MPSPVLPADIQSTIVTGTGLLCDRLKAFLNLPHLLYQFWSWAFTSSGEATTAFKALFQSVGTPAGGIVFWPSTSIPDGWLTCSGQEINRTTYASLFSVIGTTWGAPSSVTVFKLPDLRGRVPVGANNATFVFGSSLGEESHAQTIAEMPSHSHTPSPSQLEDSGPGDIPGPTIFGGVNLTGPSGGILTIGNTGNGQPFNIIQPSLVGHWIIKT